jgi:hypothetical protein
MQQRRTKTNVSWFFDDNMTICLNGFVPLVGTAELVLCNSIHEQYYCQKLLAKPKQGYQCHKTATQLPAEWQLHMFAKWRFIHRARLDCVPLNGSQPFGNRIRKCHRYAYATGTLPHILCHCKLNFVSTSKLHNAIQGRLVRAFHVSASSTTVRINHAVPGLDGSLWPDFVTVN